MLGRDRLMGGNDCDGHGRKLKERKLAKPGKKQTSKTRLHPDRENSRVAISNLRLPD